MSDLEYHRKIAELSNAFLAAIPDGTDPAVLLPTIVNMAAFFLLTQTQSDLGRKTFIEELERRMEWFEDHPAALQAIRNAVFVQ